MFMGNLHVFCVPVDHFLAIQFIANVNFLVEIMNDITPGNFPDHSHTQCSHVISLKHGNRLLSLTVSERLRTRTLETRQLQTRFK